MDNVFFWVSKLAWLLVSPSSLLVLLAVVSWLLLMRGFYSLAKWGFGGLSLLMLLIAVFPIGSWLLVPLELRFPTNPKLPEHIDGIIVLSGAEKAVDSDYWQQVEVNQAVERDLAFMTLARDYEQAKLVFTGGSSNLFNQSLKATDVAKQLFAAQGFDTSRIIFESQARNTAENASLSHQLIKPQPGEVWILITTAWHMPRSVGLFCQVNWPVIPYPVDHWTLPDKVFSPSWSFAQHLLNFNIATKEWLGLLAYYVTGKIPALLPTKCQP